MIESQRIFTLVLIDYGKGKSSIYMRKVSRHVILQRRTGNAAAAAGEAGFVDFSVAVVVVESSKAK